VSFTQVECPAALTAKSGCVRANDSINESPTGPSVVPTYSATAAASSAAASPPAPPASSPSASSSASSAASPLASSPASGSGSETSTVTVAKYGQCGGIEYTGSTTCAAGSTCTFSNPYYSQCL
jgi:hypothetical protein